MILLIRHIFKDDHELWSVCVVSRHVGSSPSPQQVHLGRQEQIRLKALGEADQLAADSEQARLDKESFLAEEEREKEKEMRKRQVGGWVSAGEREGERIFVCICVS